MTSIICSDSGDGTFALGALIDEFVDFVPRSLVGSLAGLAQQSLQLDNDPLDMTRQQIGSNHNIVHPKVGAGTCSIEARQLGSSLAIEDERRGQSVKAQTGNESGRPAMALTGSWLGSLSRTGCARSGAPWWQRSGSRQS